MAIDSDIGNKIKNIWKRCHERELDFMKKSHKEELDKQRKENIYIIVLILFTAIVIIAICALSR